MALIDEGGLELVITAIGPSYPITLTGTVNRGDVIGYDSGWKPAYAKAASVVQGRLIALDSGSPGRVIQATRQAVMVGDRLSGGAAGTPVYVAEDDSEEAEGNAKEGRFTGTKPSTTDDADTVIGIALAANQVHIFPQVNPDSLAS